MEEFDEKNFYLKFANLAVTIEKSIDSDEHDIKILSLEEIRSTVNNIADIGKTNFKHKKIKYYTHLRIPIIEMALVGFRNATVNIDIDNIEDFCSNIDEIFSMLDRFNELKENENE